MHRNYIEVMVLRLKVLSVGITCAMMDGALQQQQG